MKLFHSGTSPFVRKVNVLLIETGQQDLVERETVAVSPVNPGDLVPTVNPLGKVPCLVRDNGAALFDSRVITRYLDTLHSGPKLYPEGEAIWQVLAKEAAADGILDAAVLMAYEQRLRSDAQQSPEWLEAQWLKISRTLTYLDAQVANLSELSMASIAVGAALGYIDFRHDSRQWRSLAPALAVWEAEFAKRPSMQATQPG